jgi:DNA-binding response OmpR family regulator
VLVIDDDPGLARVVRILLVADGYEVAVAYDGQEALEAAELNGPDLVILDLQMPVMDGRTFFREFRSRGFTTPVIILSAYNSEAARQELGADAAIDKPFDPEKVGRVCRRLLEGVMLRQT